MKETLSAAPGSDRRKRSLVWDLAVIALCAAIGLTSLLALRLCREEGAYAVVKIDGREVGRYSLSSDGEYSLNGGTNILVIEGGECYLSYGDCPDGICVRTGRIRYRGQSIVCLPNRVTVSVIAEDGGVDLVS